MYTKRFDWVLRLRALAVAGVVLAASAPLLASDWYVDAVNGNDANSGASSGDAWKTISHAIQTVPIGVIQVVHIAPGTYDSALGETFPLMVQDRQQLVGDLGSASTIVAGDGPSTVEVIRFLSFYHQAWISQDTLVQGLSVRNAATGVEVSAFGNEALPVLRDVDISQCGVGLSLASGGPGVPILDVTLEHVRVHDCTVGLDTVHDAFQAMLRASISESRIDHQSAHGMYMGRATTLVMHRTRVDHNGTDGLVADDQGFSNVTCQIEDCLFADNAASGMFCVNGNPWAGVIASINRCTFANNAAAGLSAGGPYNSSTLSQSIFYGNADDLALNSSATATFCDVGDGDFAGSNGNFSADPLFADPANGDFRLRWGSPCIDSGDPFSAIGTLDLAGNARPIDGNLDTVEVSDVGAYEFAPLFLASTGELGTPLALELWGPDGNPTTVYFTRRPLVAAVATPYGELDLDRNFMGIYRHATTASGPPVTLSRTIPMNPALVGQTYSFQALTDSAAAPHGAAWSNPVQVTIVP